MSSSPATAIFVGLAAILLAVAIRQLRRRVG
jgi:MYXO-CTERM domain-containing protein